jgi:hypothetical protein
VGLVPVSLAGDEIGDGGKPFIVLSLQFGWKTFGSCNTFGPLLDPGEEIEIIQVGAIPGGLLAANRIVEFQVDWDSAHPEIGELTSKKGHTGKVTVLKRVVGRDLRNDTVGGNDFEDIQTFQDGRGKGHPSVVLQALST